MPHSAFAAWRPPSRRNCVLVAAVALLSSCTLGSGGPSAADADAGDWQLTLEQSGGIVGMHKRFTLDGAGNLLVVEDIRRGSRAERALTGDERRSLRALVAARDGAPAAQAPGRACPDCYEFTISIQGPAGKARSAHYDSRSLAGSPDDALIDWILKLPAPAPAPH